MIDLEKLRDQAEDDLKRGREWSTTSRDVLMLLDQLEAAQQESARLRAALEGLTASYEEAGPNMDRAARNRGRLALISAREVLK